MQTTNNVFLVRPANFAFNKETFQSNAFQNEGLDDKVPVQELVAEEFNCFVKTLRASGVSVYVFDDTEEPVKPDAIFPNNWISLHPDGRVILYPMCASNRREERRLEIVEALQQHFSVTEIVDLSGYEEKDRFLEGTGSIVFDHYHKVAYACLSPRTDPGLFLEVCELLQYKPVYFFAHDPQGRKIYHTNVMMCVGQQYCIICLESITNDVERKMVVDSLAGSGHEIIEISFEQMKNFAGNMLQLDGGESKGILVLSATAFDSLDAEQRSSLERYVSLLPLSVKTIESIGGGSARCMIAEIFLPLKKP